MGLINEVANIKEAISKKSIDNSKKEFYKELQQKAKAILFDKIMEQLQNEHFDEVIFCNDIKDKILNNTIDYIFYKLYRQKLSTGKIITRLSEKNQEKIIFYLDEIYYTIAKKACIIHHKRQKLKEQIEAEENKKRLLLQYEELQRQKEIEEELQAKKEKQEKKENIIAYILTTILLIIFTIIIWNI